MSIARSQLGGHNDKKMYYLYPHYNDYFNFLYAQFTGVDFSVHQNVQDIVEVIKNIIHDVGAGNMKYFQQFQAVISKLKQLQPDNWTRFTQILPAINAQSLKQIKNSNSIEINSTFYTLFGGLSLNKYLQGLNTNVMVVLNLTKMRLIDGNIDKLSRIDSQTLKQLILQSNEITVEGIKMIVKNNNWKLLQRFNINRNLLNNQGLKQLAKTQWRYLKKLQLQGNVFGDTGVDFLCKYSDWPYIQSLDLRSKRNDTTSIFKTNKDEQWFCKLTHISIQALIQKNWKNLNQLRIYIGDNQIVTDRNSHIFQKLMNVL